MGEVSVFAHQRDKKVQILPVSSIINSQVPFEIEEDLRKLLAMSLSTQQLELVTVNT
jgi:hypothetical protein